MDIHKNRSSGQFLAGLALSILAVLPSAAQDSPPPENKPAEGRKAGMIVVVTTDDHKDLPASSKVQITFRDRTCGSVFGGSDKDAPIVDGKARFEDLPVCPISIKVDVPGYLNPSKVLKAADFKPEIAIMLKAESK
jgi:hypothetical protein